MLNHLLRRDVPSQLKPDSRVQPQRFGGRVSTRHIGLKPDFRLNGQSLITTANAQNPQQGFMLLEAMIAILIFSMGILALVGLQAAMVNNTTASKFRVDGNYIAQKKLAALWADPANVAAVADGVEKEVPELPGTFGANQHGSYKISLLSAGQVRIEVKWQSPSETTQHNVTTNARVMGGV